MLPACPEGKGIAFLFLGCSLFSTMWDNLVRPLFVNWCLMNRFCQWPFHCFSIDEGEFWPKILGLCTLHDSNHRWRRAHRKKYTVLESTSINEEVIHKLVG